ncbi:hypothetical protein CFOL_v3_27895, partial [Cephalotus follicularis]
LFFVCVYLFFKAIFVSNFFFSFDKFFFFCNDLFWCFLRVLWPGPSSLKPLFLDWFYNGNDICWWLAWYVMVVSDVIDLRLIKYNPKACLFVRISLSKYLFNQYKISD